MHERAGRRYPLRLGHDEVDPERVTMSPSWTWHQRVDVLPLEEHVRRHGGRRGRAAEGAGGRERAPEEGCWPSRRWTTGCCGTSSEKLREAGGPPGGRRPPARTV